MAFNLKNKVNLLKKDQLKNLENEVDEYDQSLKELEKFANEFSFTAGYLEASLRNHMLGEELPNSELSADYHFLTACYCAHDEKWQDFLFNVEEIRKKFPNYDPVERFNLNNEERRFKEELIITPRGQTYLKSDAKKNLDEFMEHNPNFSLYKTFNRFFNMEKMLEGYLKN